MTTATIKTLSDRFHLIRLIAWGLTKLAVILCCGYWAYRSNRDHDFLQATLFTALAIIMVEQADLRSWMREHIPE